MAETKIPTQEELNDLAQKNDQKGLNEIKKYAKSHFKTVTSGLNEELLFALLKRKFRILAIAPEDGSYNPDNQLIGVYGQSDFPSDKMPGNLSEAEYFPNNPIDQFPLNWCIEAKDSVGSIAYDYYLVTTANKKIKVVI